MSEPSKTLGSGPEGGGAQENHFSTNEYYDSSEITDNEELNEIEASMLGMPKDMSGLITIELCSGNNTLSKQVADRGGVPWTLDNNPDVAQARNHYIGDATATELPPKSYDMVFIRGAPIWGMGELSKEGMAGRLILESLRLVKDGGKVSFIPILKDKMAAFENVIISVASDIGKTVSVAYSKPLRRPKGNPKTGFFEYDPEGFSLHGYDFVYGIIITVATID